MAKEILHNGVLGSRFPLNRQALHLSRLPVQSGRLLLRFGHMTISVLARSTSDPEGERVSEAEVGLCANNRGEGVSGQRPHTSILRPARSVSLSPEPRPRIVSSPPFYHDTNTLVKSLSMFDTPPLGTCLMGYAARSGGCRSVHDDLSATAPVLCDGATQLVIIAPDMLALNERIMARGRSHKGAGGCIREH